MIQDPVPDVSEQTPDPRDPAAKARTFPTTPGVYLMKDGGRERHLRRQGEEPPQPGVVVLQ